MFSELGRPRRAAWLASLLLVACGGGGEPSGSAGNEQALTRTPVKPAQEQALAAGRTAPGADAQRNYIVQLAEAPVAAYEGGIAGHAATRPAVGEKVDSTRPAVARYRNHLTARHDAVLAGAASVSGAGVGKKLHSYGYAFNGFAAELTEAQAQKLAESPGVIAVTRSARRKPATSSTPDFLGLTDHEGFWRVTGAKGEDVIIGFIDSGITPDHPSFSDRSPWGDKTYGRPRGWNGVCQTGKQFTAADCNRKLIGARYFNAGFGGDEGISAGFPFEFNSPRDYDGHGTHTASTAAGNAGVQATGMAAAFGKVSGMAPRARIAAYKACWGDRGGLCDGTDLLAAIDQAVADGADIINFSIGDFPAQTNFLDPVEQALLRAAGAGIFVAAAGGDYVYGTVTPWHPSPWVMTVAAGTHDRRSEAALSLGNGMVYTGASSSAGGVAVSPLVDAATAALPGADPALAARCLAAADNGGVPVLDPAQVAGKIVLCDHSPGFDRPGKAVLQAGGAGLVLLNTEDGPTDATSHAIPAVHLPLAERAAIKAYAALAGAAARIGRAKVVRGAAAPFKANDSVNGPTAAAYGDVLKPDLIAPGQDILAGVAPAGNDGQWFGVRSGTSFSTAHVTGIAALLKELHPGWSPMAIKSAMMTTAGNLLDGPDTEPSVIFSQGAGHVRPHQAADPGLVFDSGPDDWRGFLCGTQVPAAECNGAGVPVLDASNLNLASIAIGDLAGTQTVTRRVTNVDAAYATYTPSFTGMVGVDVAVSPASLTLAPGQTKAFRVTFTRTHATLGEPVGGQLTWSGGTSKRNGSRHQVRMPLVVRPVALRIPLEASGSYKVRFGYAGPFSATPRGLVPAVTTSATVAEGEEIELPFTIPPGTSYARIALFDADVAPQADLDMDVFDSAGGLVDSSFGYTSAEAVNLMNPAPGRYTVRVSGFRIPSSTTPLKLFVWALGTAADGNMTVSAPHTAGPATPGTISLAFSGLVPGIRYLGSVAYAGHPAMPAPTIVRVDP